MFDKQKTVCRGGGRVSPGAGARSRTTRRRSTTWATCWRTAASGSTSRSDYLKKALEIEPDNGSFLDSLGWAYLQVRQARSRRRQPAARRRSAEDQLGRSRITTVTCSSSWSDTTTRSPHGTARSPATATRSIAARSTRRSVRQSRSFRRNDGAPPRWARAVERSWRVARGCVGLAARAAADEAAVRPGRARARAPTRSHRRRAPAAPSAPSPPKSPSADRSAANGLRGRLAGRPGGAGVGPARSRCAVRPAALHLCRDRQRRHAAAAARRPRARARAAGEVLEAIAGVPLDASDLRVTLTGCATAEADRGHGASDWRRLARGAGGPGATLYLHRDARRRRGGSWRPSCRRSADARLARRVPRLPERPAATVRLASDRRRPSVRSAAHAVAGRDQRAARPRRVSGTDPGGDRADHARRSCRDTRRPAIGAIDRCGSDGACRRRVRRACAKINLDAARARRAADGYHELRTTFQSIALHDTLTFTRRARAVSPRCDDPACPADRTNLVWRAAERVWRAAGRARRRRATSRFVSRSAFRCRRDWAAAAATPPRRCGRWRALARADVARDAAAIARELGADVPFFLEGGTALGLERGDLLFPLLDAPASWVVLVLPAFGVSTQRGATGWLRIESARLSARGADERTASARQRSAGAGRRAGTRKSARLVERVAPRGALRMRAMSGSGSAVFGLFASRVAERGRGALQADASDAGDPHARSREHAPRAGADEDLTPFRARRALPDRLCGAVSAERHRIHLPFAPRSDAHA